MVFFLGSSMDRKLKGFSMTVKKMFSNSQKMTYWILIISATLIAMFWASLFLYTTFYITYLPKDVMQWDVPLQFTPCKDTHLVCSTPNAVIDMVDPRRGTSFARGQKYQVVLDLELPESPQNRNLGMFMVKVQLRSAKQKGAAIIATEYRSTMLRYKSTLLRSLSTLVLSPFMLYGVKEEKQSLEIEFFGDFEENLVEPVTHVYVEVQSKRVEFYSATLRVHAKFAGVRYLMYHYPVGTSILGIAVFMNFLSALIIFSICQFASVKDETKIRIKQKRLTSRSREVTDTEEMESKLKRQKKLQELKRISLKLSSSGDHQNMPLMIDSVQSISHSMSKSSEKDVIFKTLDMDYPNLSRSRSPSIESIAEDSSCDRDKHADHVYSRNASHSPVSSSNSNTMGISGEFDLLSDSCLHKKHEE